MNDLEHDLRALLDEKAAGAGAPTPDPRLIRRARRRQLGTAVGGVLVVAALLGGVAVAMATLGGPDRRTPADAIEPSVETTVNGVSVLHPADWSVVDPVVAGIQPASDTLPQLILLLTTADPITPEAIGCPGLTGGQADGLVMTLQHQPFALAGEGAQPWPVELVSLDTGNLAENEIEPSGCFPDWTFLRSSWTEGGRTFEARVGLGPDVSEADREALEAAYASMRFAPTAIGPVAVVIATGTAGDEDWELIATRDGGGLGLMLQWSTGGSGIGGTRPVADEIQSTAYDFAVGDHHEIVVVGAITADATTVEAVPEIGARVSVDVIDVPDPIGGALDAFVLTYVYDVHPRGATLTAYDKDGHILATGTVPPPPRD
jgi:hypothetical protein